MTSVLKVQRPKGLGLATLCAVLALACDDPAEGVEGPRAQWTSVVYHLDWALEATGDGPGWKTISDLGYEVEVQDGRVVLGTLTLEPCPMDPSPTGQQVLALHEEVPDPATLPGSYIESISPPEARRFAPITFPPTTYCRLSYRASRAISVTDGIEDYPDMNQKTVSIRGRWRHGTTGDWTSLAIETEFAFWHTLPLPGSEGSTDGAVTISLYRQLDRLFDAVDFRTLSSRRIQAQVTENLVRNTLIEVSNTQ